MFQACFTFWPSLVYVMYRLLVTVSLNGTSNDLVASAMSATCRVIGWALNDAAAVVVLTVTVTVTDLGAEPLKSTSPGTTAMSTLGEAPPDRASMPARTGVTLTMPEYPLLASTL